VRSKLSKGLMAASALAGVLLMAGGLAENASASSVIHLTYALWDPHEEIGYKQSIAVFEKSHPNIQVSVDQIAYSAYQTKLQEEFASGGGPDLFWVNTPFLSTWIKDGYLLNLAPYIKKWGVNLSIYYPSLVALHSYKGAIYGIPKDWDTIAVYYNETYMQKHHLTVPNNWTWNPTNGGTFLKFLELATTDKNGVNATSPKFNPNDVATYAIDVANSAQTGFENFWQMDGCHIIPAAWASSVTFDSPACYQTTQFIRDLMYKWHVAVPGSELGPNGTAPSGQDQDLFADGKIAMMIAGDWYTNPVYELVGKKFKIGVAMLPIGPDGRWSVFNGLIDGVNPHSPNLSAALELERWLGSPASQKIMGGGGYIWPAVKSLDPLFMKYWASKGINVQPFLAEAQGAAKLVNWPNTPGMAQALTDMASDMGPIWLGPGSLANTTSLMKAAFAAANHDLAAAGA
jgi:multiple sugar transport system substrate-binding protein